MQIEDYIDVKQTAWLLNLTIRNVQSLAKDGKLTAIDGSNKKLIEVKSLEEYFNKKLEKYETAVEFFEAPDKDKYWNTVSCRINVISNEIGYLSIPQAAYVLNNSRQAIQDMIRKNILDSKEVIIGKTTRKIISIESIKNYVDEYLADCYIKNKNLLDYLKCADKEKYWLSNQDSIKKKYVDTENARRQYYKKKYVRKNLNEWENLTNN